jgi:carbon-monoxide dehydrogenase large subunit
MMMSKYVGKPLKRLEDPKLVAGKGRYVDDINFSGILHAVFVRSPYAHAKIKKIDVSDAMKSKGVVAVYTPEKLNSFVKTGVTPTDVYLPVKAIKYVPRLPLAHGGKVRFQGDPIVMVVANDKYLAYDAAEKVSIDYEPLTPILDMEKAMLRESPLVHEELGTNVALTTPFNSGDVEKGFKEADKVVEEELYNQRVVPSAMEPRAVLANYEGDSLTLWSSTQVPHILRGYLSKILGLSENKIRVIEPDVGGGFGSKLNVYPEEMAVSVASMMLGRPIKWVATRREDMVSTIHGRDSKLKYKVGFKKDGTIVAIEGKILTDLGAYHYLLGSLMPLLIAQMLPGPYRNRNFKLEAYGVYTNKVTTDPYRGAGRPEATYFIERIMDLVADETGLDAVDVRIRNFIKSNEMPYINPFGLPYDSGNYEEVMRKGLDVLGYSDLIRWAEKEREKGRRIGVGISYYLEICGFGPMETATVRIDKSGKVTVLTGITPHGQGDAIGIAQIVADELEIPIENINVVWGDTGIVNEGFGTYGSRSISVGGSAALVAARKLKEELLRAAAKLMKADVEEIEYSEGKFVRKNTGEKKTIEEVVDSVYRGLVEASLEFSHTYKVDAPTFPYGLHIAVVEVDEETGMIKPLIYRAYDDIGNVINPLTAEGQVHGGIVQGMAQALYEEAVYSKEGVLINGNLGEYYVPSSLESPKFESKFHDKPNLSKFPTGSKGVGEAGTIASTPCYVRAVEMALRPKKVRFKTMPLRPEEVLRSISK